MDIDLPPILNPSAAFCEILERDPRCGISQYLRPGSTKSPPQSSRTRHHFRLTGGANAVQLFVGIVWHANFSRFIAHSRPVSYNALQIAHIQCLAYSRHVSFATTTADMLVRA